VSRKKKKRRYISKDNQSNNKSNYAKREFSEKRHNEPYKMTVMDTFQNLLARLGDGAPNLLNGTDYTMDRLTRNYQLMNNLYRNHWIVRKVIDSIPEDMMKNWIDIQSSLTPEQMKQLDELERKTKIKEKIKEALKWGRLYGGAAAVMVIQGHENILDEPLDYNTIMPGAFKGLIVCDRWMGIQASTEIIEDVSSPDFGMPLYYEWDCGNNGATVKVHHSRVLRFAGRDLPFIEKQVEMGWGESEVEVIYEELKKRDNASYNIANLLFMANLKVLKMQGMEEILSTGDADLQQDLYNTVEGQNRLMNSNSMMVLGKDDDFATHQYTFSGINDVYQSFMLDVAGASEIPVTKLFGRSPAGLSATGESDLQNYYDMIGQKQVSQLQPVIDKLLPVMVMSELAYIPNDLSYDFNPVAEQTEEELASIVDKKVNAINTVYQGGLITQKVAIKELKEMADTTGMFTNISDEDIANASTEYDQGEFGDFPNEDSLFNGGGLDNVDAEQTYREKIPEGNHESSEKATQQPTALELFNRYFKSNKKVCV
jgi:phage-related protein (TIGR01555 family)